MSVRIYKAKAGARKSPEWWSVVNRMRQIVDEERERAELARWRYRQAVLEMRRNRR